MTHIHHFDVVMVGRDHAAKVSAPSSHEAGARVVVLELGSKRPHVLSSDEFKSQHKFKATSQKDGEPTYSRATIIGNENRKQWEDLPIHSLGAMLLDGQRVTAMEREYLSSLLVPREENGEPSFEEKDDRVKEAQSLEKGKIDAMGIDRTCGFSPLFTSDSELASYLDI